MIMKIVVTSSSSEMPATIELLDVLGIQFFVSLQDFHSGRIRNSVSLSITSLTSYHMET